MYVRPPSIVEIKGKFVTCSGTDYSGEISTGTDWMRARALLRPVLSLKKEKRKEKKKEREKEKRKRKEKKRKKEKLTASTLLIRHRLYIK